MKKRLNNSFVLIIAILVLVISMILLNPFNIFEKNVQMSPEDSQIYLRENLMLRDEMVLADGSYQKEAGTYSGYIIEFETVPLIKKKLELEKTKATKEQILTETKKQKTILEGEHNLFKENLYSEFKEKGMTSKSNSKSLSDEIFMSEFYIAFNGVALDISDEEAEAVKKIKGVKKVHPNYKVHTTLMDSVPLIQDGILAGQLDRDGNDCTISGKECLTGEGVTIGIIDTGVDYTHRDLGGCFGEGCKVVSGYDFSDNDADPMDYMGHGTHVAATAAGNGILKGVAPDAKIYAYKVFPNSYANVIISAIERAVDPNQDGDFSNHLDVISLSLSGSGNPDDPMSTAIDNVVNAGVVAVVSAGNSGPSEQTIKSPGTARKAITVGAIDKNNNLASFSSRGPVIWTDENGNEQAIIKPDIVAPGVDICAAEYDSAWSDRKCLDEKHVAISGTSMATPHVSGAIALIKQAHPDWTPEEIRMALRSTADNIGKNLTIQGYGKINVLDLVQLKNPPAITELLISGEYDGTINITGTIKSKTKIKIYTLYLCEDEGINCIQLKQGNENIEKGIILNNFDTTNFEDNKKYQLKLIAYTSEGIKSEDNSLIEFDNYNLNYPGIDVEYFDDLFDLYYTYYQDCSDYLNNTFIQNNQIPIIGKITSKLKNYSILYSRDFKSWYSEEIRITGQLKEGKQVLGYLNTSNLEEGDYLIKLFGESNQDNVFEIKMLKFTISHSQNINYPKCERNNHLLLTPKYATIGEIERDNNAKEIVISKFSNWNGTGWSGELDVLNYNSDSLNSWPKFFRELSYSFPSIGDLNNDPDYEIIQDYGFGPDNNSALFAFNKEGDLLPSWPIELYNWHTLQPVVADINGDDKNDLIVGLIKSWGVWYYGSTLFEAKLNIYDSNSSVLTGWPFIFDKTYFPQSISNSAVGDIDKDNRLDIAVCVFDRLYILNNNGTIKKGWPINLSVYDSYREGIGECSGAKIVLADINEDGFLEIILSSSNGTTGEFQGTNGVLKVFNQFGNLLNGWPKAIDRPITALSVGKIDNLNKGLVIVASSVIHNDSIIYIYNFSGNLLDGWPIKLCFIKQGGIYPSFTPEPLIADINNDNNSEIIYGCIWENSGLYILNKEGEIISNLSLAVLDSLDEQSTLVLEDIDNDSYLDLFVISQLGLTYNWKLGFKYNPKNMYWPMYLNNPQHTGCYDCDKILLDPPTTTCTCNSCSDCTAKLKNASCDVVKLINNLNQSSGTCISQPLSNKIFDCQNYSISKNIYDGNGYGIYLNKNSNGTQIKNCVISKMGIGANVDGAENISISFSNFISNKYGVYSSLSKNLTIANITSLSNTYYGLYLRSSTTVTANNLNSCLNTKYDIYSSSSQVTFSNTQCRQNKTYGVSARTCVRNC